MTRRLAVTTLLTLGSGFVGSAQYGAGVVDDDLRAVLDETPPDQVVSVIVYLADSVDLAALKHDMSAERVRQSRQVRHERVVTALQAHAGTQAALLQDIAALADQGFIKQYESAWISNCVRVDADAAIIDALAERADVGVVFLNYPIENIGTIDSGPPQARPPGVESDVIEPGVLAVRAPEVWAMGFTGEGMLVATLDTGVDGSASGVGEPLAGLDPEYENHPEWAFYDPVTNWTFPQDSGLHGTHTMGTVCGGAPGNQVGVAPGAKWISAAVIDREGGPRTIFDAMLAFEWMVDPDGNPNTSWDVPAVCSNSWGIATGHNVPPYSTPCDSSFWSFIEACESAGTVILFSAGNEGPDPETLRRPADRATNDYQTCAVGGIDANDAPNWTMFFNSSRGPTHCSPTGDAAIKPDINAPAVNVISSFPGGGYGPLTGTSMASPHVNGVVLMLQACPYLTVDEVKQAIYDTALDLGPPGKDNDYGYGLIDAYEAVSLAKGLCSGVPLVKGGHFETAVDTSISIDLIANDYDGLPNPPGAITYLITSMPAAGNMLTDPGNGHEITSAELPYALVDYGNEVIYTPTGSYYGDDTFTFKANDGGVPPDAGDSELAEISILVLFDPPQIVTESLPLGVRNEPLDPVQLAADQGQPELTWEIFIGDYEEDALGAVAFATGTAQGWHADDGTWAYSLPFLFPFFGEDFDTIYVCSNGFIDFAPGDTDATHSVPEFVSAKRIAPFWADLRTDTGGDIYIDTTVAGQVTIRWDAISYWGNLPCRFSATLFADGRIRFDYGSGNNGVSPTVGLSYGNGQNYLLASYNATGTLANAASLLFDPPADQLPSGLGLTPQGLLSGTPTVAGVFEPAFRVTDSLGRSDTRQYELHIFDAPTPPQAYNQGANTSVNTPIAVTLPADDDGLPIPPGALSYVIESLPAHGTLNDPMGGEIDATPYVLAGFGHEVVYTPGLWYVGGDGFTFRANDGDVAPHGGDSNLANVAVIIEVPSIDVIYSFPLDSDPGWTTQGLWQFGQPTGGGSQTGDPTSGFTGSNVYGYNLAGDYPNGMTQTEYLTTNAIDCSSLFDVELRFRRWLGVERMPFDRATVDVSTNGSQWTQIWSNPLTNVKDSAWSLATFDIATIADGQSTLYIRWGMGPTDNTVSYPGWNIDDVEIWGWGAPTCPDDQDGDGDVDFDDLVTFMNCMSGPNALPGGNCDLSDIDQDGDSDMIDMAIFQEYFAPCGG